MLLSERGKARVDFGWSFVFIAVWLLAFHEGLWPSWASVLIATAFALYFVLTAWRLWRIERIRKSGGAKCGD